MHPLLSSVVPDLRRFFAECLGDPVTQSPGHGTVPLPGNALPKVHGLRAFERSASGQLAARILPRPTESFERFALLLFDVQYELNTAYRHLCDARGVTPEGVKDWRDIPAVATAAFKEFTFSCIDTRDRTAHFESSGTSQSARSRSHHSLESLQLYHASLLPWFQRHLLPETVDACPSPAAFAFISLTPPKSQAPHSSLVHMLDVVSAQPWFHQATFAGECDAAGAWRLDAAAVPAAVQRAILRHQPVLLTGTAFNFVHLLDGVGERDMPLPTGSRLMETGGYKGRSRELPKDELHAALSAKLGLHAEAIVTEYGMTELGSQAYDQVAGKHSPKRILQFPPWVRASVVSMETGREVSEGESGLLRIVDLSNAFSVIAVETEDLAVRHPEGITLVGRRLVAEPRGCSLMAE